MGRRQAPQQKRFAAYMEGLAKAAGHADRNGPLKSYCTGLLLPGERKSVEPMAARWTTSFITQ
jgi:SRSO17 transposase